MQLKANICVCAQSVDTGIVFSRDRQTMGSLRFAVRPGLLFLCPTVEGL